jgi:hypothetical protein
MNLPPAATMAVQNSLPVPKPPAPGATHDPKLRKAFDSFVGEAMFGQMLKGMRKTLGKPAYFYGGRAEEIFQQQLDQVLAEKLSNASAERLTGPMFELFTLERK